MTHRVRTGVTQWPFAIEFVVGQALGAFGDVARVCVTVTLVFRTRASTDTTATARSAKEVGTAGNGNADLASLLAGMLVRLAECGDIIGSRHRQFATLFQPACGLSRGLAFTLLTCATSLGRTVLFAAAVDLRGEGCEDEGRNLARRVTLSHHLIGRGTQASLEQVANFAQERSRAYALEV